MQICKDVACGEPMLLYTTPDALIREQPLRDALQVSTPWRKPLLVEFRNSYPTIARKLRSSSLKGKEEPC